MINNVPSTHNNHFNGHFPALLSGLPGGLLNFQGKANGGQQCGIF